MRVFLLFIILFSSTVNAKFKYDSFQSELYTIQANTDEGKKSLDLLRKKINTLISEDKNNPWLLYAMGDLEWEYIGTFKTKDYFDQDGNISSRSPLDLDELAQQKIISFEFYHKAYHAHVNGTDKLDTKMLLHLQDTATDIMLKIDIHRTILKEESRVGGIFGPNNTKIEFRRGLVSSMIRVKEYRMALLELDKVEQEFPAEQSNTEWRDYFTEQINNKVTK